MLSFSITFLSLLAYHTSAYVLFNREVQEVDVNETSTSVRLARRDETDPANFGWIKRWAAIGDSFTAGIGSGKLYSQQKDDYKCSRYDLAYPALANNAFGPAVEDFQFAACSGDRSLQIYDQISAVQGNLDLVMMTAGGNDLCLVGSITIETCKVWSLTETAPNRLASSGPASSCPSRVRPVANRSLTKPRRTSTTS